MSCIRESVPSMLQLINSLNTLITRRLCFAWVNYIKKDDKLPYHRWGKCAAEWNDTRNPLVVESHERQRVVSVSVSHALQLFPFILNMWIYRLYAPQRVQVDYFHDKQGVSTLSYFMEYFILHVLLWYLYCCWWHRSLVGTAYCNQTTFHSFLPLLKKT